MAALHAFVDDSASDRGDLRLFMAGFLNRADKWALFSQAWDQQLKSDPPIHYLKMAEANNLRGQFKGWTKEARDEKLRDLARVIRHFQPLSFEISVPRDQYYRLVKPAAPRGLANPHFVCVFGVLSIVTRFAAAHKITMPIKFIFDEQTGVSVDVRVFFDQVVAHLPRKAKRLISGTPAFEDDRAVLPLQAADMLAWHVRREHEQCGPQERLPMADWLRNSNGHLISGFDEAQLQSWAEGFGEVPGVSGTQSKAQWRAVRRSIARELTSDSTSSSNRWHGRVTRRAIRWMIAR